MVRSTMVGLAPPATAEKATSMNTRPVMAGLAKLQPRPPNRHLTQMMANRVPMTHCQAGTLVLRLRASSRPVTTADRSPMVCFLLVTILNSASPTRAVMTQAAITIRDFRPKITTEATVAGSRAMSTSSMIRLVEAPL